MRPEQQRPPRLPAPGTTITLTQPTQSSWTVSTPPGQVGLRRYRVTEVVTETEAGQRHELQVEAEPIDDTEIGGVTAPFGQPGEPADTASAEPHDNDWFRPKGTLRADSQVRLLLS